MKLLLYITTALLLSTNSRAQTLSPHWAAHFYGTDTSAFSAGGNFQSMTTDKHGNVYALVSDQGSIYADGHISKDSNTTTVLASWDCDGNFRWMKSLGAINTSNVGSYVATDTMEGVYVTGVATTNSMPGTVYWDNDTTMNIAVNRTIRYLMKYNSQGQLQWFRTPVNGPMSPFDYINGLSVTPNGNIFWHALLGPGTYDGGSFFVNNTKYYAVNFNAAGTYQGLIPFDMTPLSSVNPVWKFDQATNRFYCHLGYAASTGPLLIGNTSLSPPPSGFYYSAVLASFDKQGNNLWVRQGSLLKLNSIAEITFGKDGTIFLAGNSDVGNIFCGDTATNTLSQNNTSFLMALDTNANLIWSRHAASDQGSYFSALSHVNNSLVVTGSFGRTLTFGAKTVTRSYQYANAFILSADIANGNAIVLDTISGSNCAPYLTAVDKNSNVFLAGSFLGTIKFANDNLTAYQQNSSIHFNEFMLKYKNIACNCNLTQPSFIMNNSSLMNYQFTYTGQAGYTSISWDFGDGSPAGSGTNPSHTYTAQGIYAVCVKVVNGCGSNATCQYVNLNTPTGINETYQQSAVIYPNPATDILNLDNIVSGNKVQVTDLLGRVLKNTTVATSHLKMDVSDLPDGLYIVKLIDKENHVSTLRFVKN